MFKIFVLSGRKRWVGGVLPYRLDQEDINTTIIAQIALLGRNGKAQRKPVDRWVEVIAVDDEFDQATVKIVGCLEPNILYFPRSIQQH